MGQCGAVPPHCPSNMKKIRRWVRMKKPDTDRDPYPFARSKSGSAVGDRHRRLKRSRFHRWALSWPLDNKPK